MVTAVGQGGDTFRLRNNAQVAWQSGHSMRINRIAVINIFNVTPSCSTRVGPRLSTDGHRKELAFNIRDATASKHRD